VGGWLTCQDFDQQDHFEILVKCLRLHHMSAAFLTSVVSWSEYREGWPGLVGLCTNALMYQSMAASLTLVKNSDRAHQLTSCKPRRSPAAFEYDFEAQVQLAQCLAAAPGQDPSVSTRLGVAEGYLIELIVKKKLGAGGQATVGLYLGLRYPDTTANNYETGDTVSSLGPMVSWQVDVNGRTVRDFIFLYGEDFSSRGYHSFFKKPWDEVVREGSDNFPKGRMMIKVKARFISDRHVNGEQK
jgi:hypothetical protein